MSTTRINGVKTVSHIDDETGELICKTEGTTEIKDNVLSDKELKKKEYNESHVVGFNKGEGFVKMFTDVAYALSLELKPQEYQIALGLSKFVSYEDCSLKNGYGKSSHFMDLNEISEVMHIEYSRTSRVVSALIKKGVLGQIKVGNREDNVVRKMYVMNPWLCINGKNPSKEVYEYFERSGWKEIISSVN